MKRWNYFDPYAPRSTGRYYPWMPFTPFISPIGTEPEKDHWLEERSEDILPARDYFNGELFNVGPNLRGENLPSLVELRKKARPMGKSLGQVGPAGTWGPVALIAGAALVGFLLMKKK